MIITRKAIPRRTVLRGLGASLALPLLDGMVPAARGDAQHRGGPDQALRRRLRPERDDDEPLDAEDRGRRLRVPDGHEAAGAVPPLRPGPVGHARRRQRGAARPLVDALPDRRAVEAGQRLRSAGRGLGGPDRRAHARAADAASPPWSWRSTGATSPGRATTASVAPTRTPFRGRTTRRRCRWRTTRASSSSGCSGIRGARIRPSAERVSARTPASSIR